MFNWLFGHGLAIFLQCFKSVLVVLYINQNIFGVTKHVVHPTSGTRWASRWSKNNVSRDLQLHEIWIYSPCFHHWSLLVQCCCFLPKREGIKKRKKETFKKLCILQTTLSLAKEKGDFNCLGTIYLSKNTKSYNMKKIKEKTDLLAREFWERKPTHLKLAKVEETLADSEKKKQRF